MSPLSSEEEEEEQAPSSTSSSSVRPMSRTTTTTTTRPGLRRQLTAPPQMQSSSTTKPHKEVKVSALQRYVYKEMHKKYMKDMFKSWHQMRKVARMSPEQKRQMILGVGVGLSMASRMEMEVIADASRFKKLCLLVLVPFVIPPILVLGLPLLLLALPLLAFGTTLMALHSKAAMIRNQNKKKRHELKRSKSRFSSMMRLVSTRNLAIDSEGGDGYGEQPTKKHKPRRSLSFVRRSHRSTTSTNTTDEAVISTSTNTAKHSASSSRPMLPKRSRTFAGFVPATRQ